MNYEHYVDILKNELERRFSLNAQYSLRAFARDLNISHSYLSEVLNFKKGLSGKSALKVCQSLNFNKNETEYFCTLVNAIDGKSKKVKLEANKILEKKSSINRFKKVDEDSFKIISNWYYFAILELIEVKEFNSDPEWISKKLGISKQQVQIAIERLFKLGMIEKSGNKIISTGVQLDIRSEIPSKSIRDFNDQVIDKAKKSIHFQDIDKRHLSTLTTALNKEDYKKATSMIEEFKIKFNDFIMKRNNSNKPTDVYCLSMQFFNLVEENYHE